MLDMGVSSAKIRVIGNGIDPHRFKPVDPQVARHHLNISETGPVILSVGSLIPRKGFQYLIPAFARIAPCVPDARLYIIGEGSFRHELERLVESLEIQNRVFLIGNRPNAELNLWFSAADVSCLVSSREGWPNVLQESLACGTPVVATRLWGAPEVITSPELGLLVEQDVQAIAGALDSALSKRWDRKAIATHAHQRTWEVVSGEVEDYLTETVRNATNSQRSL
jgi:glycosyltransferase involved in cell wall biosynthesis